jgi:hypothetical protein
MAAVEINISMGQLRQPGIWGKILIPWNGNIYEFNQEKGYELTAKGTTRTITFPDIPDGGYVVMGVRGYHGAGGNLVYMYLVFKVQGGFFFDFAFPNHLTKFECKGLRMMEKSEEGLQPLYDTLRLFKVESVDKLQEFLRKEGIDKSAAPAAAPAPAATPAAPAAPAAPAVAGTRPSAIPGAAPVAQPLPPAASPAPAARPVAPPGPSTKK